MSVDTQRAFSSPRLVTLFNEWMRRFTEEPEKFQAEFKSVGKFLQEDAAGKEPGYGRHCTEFLAFLDDDLQATAVPAPPKPTTVQKGGLPHRKRKR